MRKIQDEFSARTDVSPQRLWQLRKAAKGLCPICGGDLLGMKHYCPKHTMMNRVYARRKNGAQPQWRYQNDPK